jgi:hypothetical protein
VSRVVITQQFRGPPQSGNGGYVCGLMASLVEGPATGVLRAPIPLDLGLDLARDGDVVRLTGAEGALIGEASPAAVDLPAPPPAPTYAQAEAAGRTFVGLGRPFHPVCFTCGDRLDEGFGLRVFVGQVAGAPAGQVAGVWTPHAAFGDADGLARPEVIWAALDCPGSVAWVVSEGGGGLLGTMTCEILARPKVGQPCIVSAWPIEQSGRKRISGTALFSADGALLARSLQVWIGRPPVASPA